MKIMITGINGMFDNGEVAILVGIITNLKRQFPGAQFYLGLTFGEFDENQLKRVFPTIYSDIKLVKYFYSRKIHWTLRAILVYLIYILVYPRCDMGIHLGADGYSDNVMSSRTLSILSSVGHSYQILLGLLFRKPVIACSMTIGPFNNTFTRSLARFVLNRVNLITAREKITKDYLKRLGIFSPTYLVADAAFLMEPVETKKLNILLKRENSPSNKKFICIAPSQIIHQRITAQGNNRKKYEMYIEAMVMAVNYLFNKDLEIILICQTTGGRHDDRQVAYRIQEQAKYKPQIFDNRNYTPQQLKYIIRHCQIMISSKLHSAIAATSAGIPTVTIASHFKIYSIIGDMLGQKDLIVDISTPDFSQFESNLLNKIEKCFLERAKIQNELHNRLPTLREMALHNTELIAALINEKKKKSSK